MLKTENNIQSYVFKNQRQKRKIVLEYQCYLAAKYLTRKFLNCYNLKDPKSKTSKQLIKIFLYFLRYKVYNVDLIKASSKDKGDFLEFRVNLFSKSNNDAQENNNCSNEVISINGFFNNNIKLIII